MYLFHFKGIWKDLQTIVRVENRVSQNGVGSEIENGKIVHD